MPERSAITKNKDAVGDKYYFIFFILLGFEQCPLGENNPNADMLSLSIQCLVRDVNYVSGEQRWLGDMQQSDEVEEGDNANVVMEEWRVGL